MTTVVPQISINYRTGERQLVVYPPGDNDLISQDRQNKLMYWRDQMTEGAFEIGDITNAIIEENSGRSLTITNDRVYGAVSRFCGRSLRTVRYYAETSYFYPKESGAREKYHMLPFSHFVLARSFGDSWENVLAYAAAHPEASAEELRRTFAAAGPDQPADREQSCETSQDCQDDTGKIADGLLADIIMDADLESRLDQASNMRNFSGLAGKRFPTMHDRLSVMGELVRVSDRFAAMIVEVSGEDGGCGLDKGDIQDVGLLVGDIKQLVELLAKKIRNKP